VTSPQALLLLRLIVTIVVTVVDVVTVADAVLLMTKVELIAEIGASGAKIVIPIRIRRSN
jgi:hypothetical protein